jgi:hypothetical protein
LKNHVIAELRWKEKTSARCRHGSESEKNDDHSGRSQIDRPMTFSVINVFQKAVSITPELDEG